MSIVSSINKSVGKVMNYTAKNTFAKQLQKGLKEPAKFAAKTMVISIISKDIVNCVFYTYQSANNKKIPEDKRGFVAALDAVNGIINVGGQFLSAMLVERFLTPILQGKAYTGVLKNAKTGVEEQKFSKAPLASDNLHNLTLEVIKEKRADLELKGVNVDNLIKNAREVSEKVIDKLGHSSSKGKDLATGLGIIVGSLATMALIKRTITPLIATPLAGMLKDNFSPKGEKKSENQSDKMLEPNYKPWLDKTANNKNGMNKDQFRKTA